MPNRGPKIPLRIRQYIAEEALERRKMDRRLLATKIRTVLADAEEVTPAVETIEKII